MHLMIHLANQIQTLHSSTEIPGLAVAVIKNGQNIYSSGFGQDGDIPLTAATPFEVASLSKPVFAYAVLQLCQQGILNLDTPITHYLPTPYTPDEPSLSLMTVRHALSHSTGFPNWRDESGLRAGFHPGSSFHYSTEGMIYLQTALEHVIQQPLHTYARENIFEPFGMHHSEFLPIDMSPFPAYLPRHLHSFGAISLQTTADDYARFVIEMMGQGSSDKFRLGEKMLAEMLVLHVPVGNQKELFWGLGWGVHSSTEGRNSFWHWGQRGRSRNFAIGSREERAGVVIFTNHESGLTICESIVTMVMEYPAHPAFKWLLPAEKWRADGHKEEVEA
jgi:CubicO group peptidase (beta-lactamase class C family)